MLLFPRTTHPASGSADWPATTKAVQCEWYELGNAANVTFEETHKASQRAVGDHEELCVFDQENLPVKGACSPMDVAPWAEVHETYHAILARLLLGEVNPEQVVSDSKLKQFLHAFRMAAYNVSMMLATEVRTHTGYTAVKNETQNLARQA
ncbi:hypothetical protein OK351_11035 [Glutamicibacter sp. MNS18]|uniref:hypothetical protein n=1 Tax=Glutamicibacter sp. MNS18 TaxID=2989817 RepID=UPI00223676F7|nr:hypothetical protein [Glutamicibacter sp. MNS18]MCW4466036.1 hypothetical protein [Glutamicibacter sp. MNS18]